MRPSKFSAVIGLLGAANAAPYLSYHASKSHAAPSLPSSDFKLAVEFNSTYRPLTAASNGTSLLVLQVATGNAPGTPTFANQTSVPSTPGYNTSLILDITNNTGTADVPAGNYGLSVPDLGDVYGATESVVAKKDYQEFGFQIDEDAIYHVLTSASQSWFTCVDSVNGNAQQSYFLKWGVFTSGGNVPDGCSVTNVVQVLES